MFNFFYYYLLNFFFDLSFRFFFDCSSQSLLYSSRKIKELYNPLLPSLTGSGIFRVVARPLVVRRLLSEVGGGHGGFGEGKKGQGKNCSDGFSRQATDWDQGFFSFPLPPLGRRQRQVRRLAVLGSPVPGHRENEGRPSLRLVGLFSSLMPSLPSRSGERWAVVL